MKRLGLLIFSLLMVSQVIASLAEACSCMTDPYSKQYIYLEKTWYGSKRKWTCNYTCRGSNGQVETLVGTHEDWYMGSDSGLEGICDGLRYVNRYNNYVQNFVWTLEGAEPFSPGKSSAPELKQWYHGNCR